jgi:hypothetical protein
VYNCLVSTDVTGYGSRINAHGLYI